MKHDLPSFSAARRAPTWQKLSAGALICAYIGACIFDPAGMLAVSALCISLPFLGIMLVRLVALLHVLWPARRNREPAPQRERDLPVYTILAALYDEAAVLPDLIKALSRLDYPPAKLDCMLVIEAADAATQAALQTIVLPGFMRVVVVPEGPIRTKPRALNYALTLARGEYVVVYDAEDRPEPDQLLKALAAFQSYGANVACVQASLNIYNPKQSWLTRQFTLEYSALFDAILPALQWLRFPIPLGGTSNHFPRALLEELHSWDPYNVTEDADLGIRIARLGYNVATINSTTWEEAPVTLNLWRKQRTRWIKGWLQTYLVHTRTPFGLSRDLGVVRALGFHVYLGGLIISALVHPLFYLALGLSAVFDLEVLTFDNQLGPLLWLISIANLAISYIASILVGILATRRRGHRLAISALFIPIYWLLISAAAYRALWQFFRDPYRWEKTQHGLAKM